MRVVLSGVVVFLLEFDRNRFLNEREIDRPELLVFLFCRSTDANESSQRKNTAFAAFSLSKVYVPRLGSDSDRWWAKDEFIRMVGKASVAYLWTDSVRRCSLAPCWEIARECSVHSVDRFVEDSFVVTMSNVEANT